MTSRLCMAHEIGWLRWVKNVPPIVKMLGLSTMDISANDLMWEFFQKHPRGGTSVTKS